MGYIITHVKQKSEIQNKNKYTFAFEGERKMKKIIALIATLVLSIGCVFGLTACGKKDKIGVQAGTTGSYFVKGDEDWGFDGLKNYSVAEYDTPALAVQALKNNQVKYVIIDKDPANVLAKSVDGIKVLPYELNVEEYGIGVDKSQPELLTSINGVLDQIKNDGTLDQIIANYNSDTYTPAGIVSATYDPSKQGKQLVVATNAGFAPFEYKSGDKFCGIDMEICQKIAEALEMELVISDMEFPSVVASVGKNGVDIAASGMTINAVRKKSVSFTNAYYSDAAQVLVVLESDTTFDECKSKEDILNLLNK